MKPFFPSLFVISFSKKYSVVRAADMLTHSISRAQLKSLIGQGDWADIIELCKLVLNNKARTDVGRIDCCNLLGKAWVEKGDDVAAIAAYTESLKQQPNQPSIHYALGVLYTRQKRNSRAICHYQTALQQRPNWGQAAYKLGNLFRQLGQGDQAIETYQNIIQHTPDHAESYFALGALYDQSGQRELAIKQYRQALFVRPDRLNAYRHVGAALTRMGEFAAAAEVYRQSLGQFPDSALMHGNLGQMQLIQGNTHEAMEAYHRSLSLDPKLSLIHQNLGLLWCKHQNLDKAAGYFREALKLEPDSISVLGNYAGVLLAQGDWPNLFDCFRMAIAQQSEWIEAYCQKTLQLSDQDLLFRAQRICGRFLMGLQQAETASTESILEERLCQLYKHMGDFSAACNAPDRAEQCYRVALAVDPNELEVYSELGKVLMVQGRRAAAIAIYQAGILQSQQTSAQSRAAATTSHAETSHIETSHIETSHIEASHIEASPTVATTETLKSQLESALRSITAAYKHETIGIYHRAEDWLVDYANKSAAVGAGPQNIERDTASPAAYVSIPVPAVDSSEPKCGGVTCQLCMGKLMRKFSPAQVGQKSYQCRPEADASNLSFPTFTATIPQGRVWIAPQKSTWDICNEIAVFTPDQFLLGDLSRAFPWYLPGCERHNIDSFPVLQRPTPLPDVRQVSGKVAVLSALSGHIYYHWIFDVLPRIDILKRDLAQQGLTLDDIDYFVVNSLEKKFQQETLLKLDIPLEKVIFSDRTPHLQAEQLVVPSFPGYLDWVPPSSMDFLRSTFLPAEVSRKGGESKKLTRRLYISRSKAKYRHLFNEAAVEALLKRFGFETVALETMSVAEQAKLFAEAEAIVTPHGSGLANLVFCSPGAVVVECFSPHYVRTDYWMISQYLKLNHYYLVGEGITCYPLRQLMYPSGLTEDVSIDIAALRSLLKTAGLNPL